MSASFPLTRLAFGFGAFVLTALATAAVCDASPAVTSSVETVGIQTATDSSALQPAVRLNVTEQVLTIAPETVNRSNCRTGDAQAAMTISMADISYVCPVYAGGQTTIDAGFVTLVDGGKSSLLARQPGDAGTLWLAAHRTSHGGAFAAVPLLADGAAITITRGTTQFNYVIVGRAYVAVRDGLVVDSSGQATHEATVDAMIRLDHGGNQAPRLLLQTCDGANHLWMIYADLVP